MNMDIITEALPQTTLDPLEDAGILNSHLLDDNLKEITDLNAKAFAEGEAAYYTESTFRSISNWLWL